MNLNLPLHDENCDLGVEAMSNEKKGVKEFIGSFLGVFGTILVLTRLKSTLGAEVFDQCAEGLSPPGRSVGRQDQAATGC